MIRGTVVEQRSWQEITMIRIALASAVLFLFAGAAFAQGNAAHGKQVFTDSKCSVCHSIAGQGNKKGPLDEAGSKLSAADVRMWITSAPDMAAKAKADRKPPMKGYPDMAKADLDDLVAYVSSLKKK
jgi:mono/diheme cytochrome c family protein